MAKMNNYLNSGLHTLLDFVLRFLHLFEIKIGKT